MFHLHISEIEFLKGDRAENRDSDGGQELNDHTDPTFAELTWLDGTDQPTATAPVFDLHSTGGGTTLTDTHRFQVRSNFPYILISNMDTPTNLDHGGSLTLNTSIAGDNVPGPYQSGPPTIGQKASVTLWIPDYDLSKGWGDAQETLTLTLGAQ